MRVRGKRRLLNSPGFSSTGAIVAEVEDTSGWKPGCNCDGEPIKSNSSWGAEPDVIWQFADCSRSISFECHWSTPEGRRNTLRKIDTMIKTLAEFREAVKAEQALYVRRQRDIKRNAD